MFQGEIGVGGLRYKSSVNALYMLGHDQSAYKLEGPNWTSLVLEKHLTLFLAKRSRDESVSCVMTTMIMSRAVVIS